MKKIAYILPVIVIAIVAAIMATHKKDSIYQKDSGLVFGTSYNIIYEYDENLKDKIEATLKDVDTSLSPFNKQSTITAINENRSSEMDTMMQEVITLAAEVNKETDGAFDITVAPLVNAWGFGFKTGEMPNDAQVDSLKQLVGFDKVRVNGKMIEKTDSRIMLDCSAIAKGYGVDKVAQMLESLGIENYMVEIGGEIVVKGKNSKHEDWHIGVTKPVEDSLSVENELQTTLSITNIAMATSGNYRNFYYKGNRRYAHTIDPKTGYPVQHNILSATVFADHCAKADAYATAFMVMGMEGAMKVLNKHKELKAYLIYNDENGEYRVWKSEGLIENGK